MTPENQQSEQTIPEENKELKITEEVSIQLHQAGKWSKFLAIVGFVSLGLMVFAGIVMSIAMAFLPSQSANMFPFPTFLIGLIYVVMAAIYVLPILYLYRFSSSIRQALFTKDQGRFSNAFQNLKAHYRFIAILMIVMFCLYILMIIGMIGFGISSGFSGFPGMNA